MMRSKPASTLKEHLIECEARYQAIDLRLSRVEQKVDDIAKLIDDVKNQIIKLAIRSAIGIVLLITSAVFVIKL
jgi:hypothetical protein